ncbi:MULTISPECIES: hypothetical protein [Psychrobacter]|nr:MULTISPECIES: hypothetical protein [Psychrobacter]
MKNAMLALSLIATLTVSGCQSIQFVDSPIPVTADFNQHLIKD